MKRFAITLSAATALMVLSGCVADGGYYGAGYGYNGGAGYGYGYGNGQYSGRGYGGNYRDYDRGDRGRYGRSQYDYRR